jgi:hypothetical protein
LERTASALPAIVSTPALAAALQNWRPRQPVPPWDKALAQRALAPMYRLSASSVAEEIQSTTRLVGEVAERLRRLTRAYGEWRVFEAGPYFDLTPTQVALLTRVVERAATVHVVFFVDALLPAFQAVHRCAALPMTMAEIGAEHDEMICATLTGRWQRMLEVVNGVCAELQGDISFLAFSGAMEEQARWAHIQPGSNRSLEAPWTLTPANALPTLTLSVDFPLPAFRQPGRKRRLRRTWQRLHRQPADRKFR